jgi:hypothetical protein
MVWDTRTFLPLWSVIEALAIEMVWDGGAYITTMMDYQ